MSEIGLSDWVCETTVINSDSVTAIDWAKFGEIIPGNKYLALGYHQTREWIISSEINPVDVRRWDNISDMGTKPVERQVIDMYRPRLLIYVLRGLSKHAPGIHTTAIQESEARRCCRRCKPSNNGGTCSIC